MPVACTRIALGAVASRRLPDDGASAMPDPLAFVADDLARLDADGLRRTPRTYAAQSGRRVVVDGRSCLDFASNDYLGLARPLDDNAKAAFGGSGSSALVSGRSPELAELEARLARFEGEDAALVFPTGYAANLGTAAAIAGPGDTVFADKLNHSCLIEGAKLSGATLRVYRSDRLERLRDELAKATTGRRVIQTDGVFSMDGTLAPLPNLLELADEFDALLMVDEAHATGVFGERGRGACEHFELSSPRLLRTGTLSKAFGCLGGFVAATRDRVEWLRHHARTQMFATALPPAICRQAIGSLDRIESPAGRAARKALLRSADDVRHTLRSQGWSVLDSIGPIVPVLLDAPERAVAVAAALERRGVLVGCIRPPTVPRGTSRLRISLSAAHSDDDRKTMCDAMQTVAAASV